MFIPCMFSLSVGHQDNHTALNKAVSTYITKQSKNVSETDSRDLRILASNVIKANSWIGEDTILMTANYLRRPFKVYFLQVALHN